jgi:copper homeostasis protein (lipoprotein)
MKKIVFFAAASAVLLLNACNSCNGNKSDAMVMEMETDSIYMLNDSTIADAQTFVFEGLAPMANNAPAEVVLAFRTISLNQDGTYTITTDYIDEGLATQTDNGDAVIIMGTANDSTATIIELVSANNMPPVNFRMQGDSSLVRVNRNGAPISNDPAHKLNMKK